MSSDEEKALSLVDTRSFRRGRRHESVTVEAPRLDFHAVEPVDVDVKDLVVRVDTTPSIWQYMPEGPRNRLQDAAMDQPLKTILDGVSANMRPGTLTAILGGSGSGKTSLLNVIAGRMRGGRIRASGSIMFNGQDDIDRIRSAYVMQQDVLIPTLTVRETLQYAADLRLPPPTTEHERKIVVEQVILELGLKECADTRIGNKAHKGCSGGEKRRTSIGVQMLANPSVLFCDEPTTGLDATSAFQVVRTLKHLARDGRTIIISIHAPRSEIWGLFDNVVLLSRGSVLFSGPASVVLDYFGELQHRLPPFVNPAEFLIDLAAYDNRSTKAESRSYVRIERLKAAWKATSERVDQDRRKSRQDDSWSKQRPEGEHDAGLARQNLTFRRQFKVLTARTLKVTIRDPLGVAGSAFEAVALAVMMGWIFFNLDTSLSGIRSRLGGLYIASNLHGYLVLLYETFRLTIDIQLFDRERSEGVVGVPAFLFSRRAAKVFLEDLPMPILFSIIFYFMAGYRLVTSEFFIFIAVTVLSQYISVMFAAVCVGLSRNFSGAVLLANLSFTFQSLTCGFFVQANQIAIYVKWVKWIAYAFYTFSVLCANEFIGPKGPPLGQFYNCPYSHDPSDPRCKEYTGLFVMQSLGFPSNWISRPIVILCFFVALFFTCAGLILHFKKVEVDVAQARNAEGDLSAGKEKLAVRRGYGFRRVRIRLVNYALEIKKRSLHWRGLETRHLHILKPITADFLPGQLNVIMGPSGSGKTTLLSSIAQRLHSSFRTKYQLSGEMLYNGAIPSESVIRSVVSFVAQVDDALMPSLTVRESLRFAAGLRLPPSMSKEEKDQRAEDILLKMGLRDCANNLIGNDLIKGISGGEKRRVTIAIQILTDPKVLLLDEPTSGLDAFTAISIIDVLNGLAAEGRTIILTIHQPRSDIFRHFSNILLLARGGHLVYAGRGPHMLPHFENLGFRCPQATNPADFVLDLITVDLQAKDREAASRQRVEGLIANWQNCPSGPTRQPALIATPAELGSLTRPISSFSTIFPLVLRRSAINISRQPALFIGRIMQVVGMVILLALFFSPLRHDYESVQSRMGFLQETISLYFVVINPFLYWPFSFNEITGMVQNIAVYPNERDVFYREEEDQCYSVEAFVLQYTCLEVPFEIVSSLVYAAIAAFAVDLGRSPRVFIAVAFNCFCIVNCGESIGIMFCTLFSHAGFAVNVTSVVLAVFCILGGIMSLNVPSTLGAINNISPIKYAVRNLAPYSMDGQHFTCTDAQLLPNGKCPIETGGQVLKLYNLDSDAAMNVLALGICAVIYRLVAYAFLKGIRSHGLRDIVRRRIRRESEPDW